MKKIFSMSLRHKVQLERRVQVSDDAGGFAESWEKVATLWASIDRVRAGERYMAGLVTASATHLFRFRHVADISPSMRLSYEGRIFNIRSIHDVGERQRILEVYAEEGAAS